MMSLLCSLNVVYMRFVPNTGPRLVIFGVLVAIHRRQDRTTPALRGAFDGKSRIKPELDCSKCCNPQEHRLPLAKSWNCDCMKASKSQKDTLVRCVSFHMMRSKSGLSPNARLRLGIKIT